MKKLSAFDSGPDNQPISQINKKQEDHSKLSIRMNGNNVYIAERPP